MTFSGLTPEDEFRANALEVIAKVRRLGIEGLHPTECDVETRPLLQAYYRCCHSCGRIASLYMVRDEVWAAAGHPPEGWISCPQCLEKDLGRPLTIDDFDRLPRCNDILFFVYDMAKRSA